MNNLSPHPKRASVALNADRVIVKERLIPVGAEEEEAAELGEVNVIHADLHIVFSMYPVEIIAELVLAAQGLLRHIYILSNLRTIREVDIRISNGPTAEDRIGEGVGGSGKDRIHHVLKMNIQ